MSKTIMVARSALSLDQISPDRRRGQSRRDIARDTRARRTKPPGQATTVMAARALDCACPGFTILFEQLPEIYREHQHLRWSGKWTSITECPSCESAALRVVAISSQSLLEWSRGYVLFICERLALSRNGAVLGRPLPVGGTTHLMLGGRPQKHSSNHE